MKWIGALLCIAATSFIGFDLSRGLHQRSVQLRDLIHSLRLLEAEMAYSQMPLEMVFTAVSQKTRAPVSTFYSNLATQLSGIVSDFPRLWDKELKLLKSTAALQDSELNIMRQFGQSLGQHPFIQQQKQITLTVHHLERELEEANERRKKYEKMWRTLGVLTGLFIVLLLF